MNRQSQIKSKLKRAVPHIVFSAIAIASTGWMFVALYFTRESDWNTTSSFLMPFPIMLYSLLLSLASMMDAWGKIDLRPKMECWSMFVAALVASYACSFLPESALEATILSVIISMALWLISVQITRKHWFKALTKRKIAKAMKVTDDDPDVHRLANSDDLPKAIVATVLITIQVWLLVSSPEFADWLPKINDTAQTFSTGAARSAAFIAGWTAGIMYHRYCPNQTEIRELAKKSNPEERKGH